MPRVDGPGVPFLSSSQLRSRALQDGCRALQPQETRTEPIRAAGLPEVGDWGDDLGRICSDLFKRAPKKRWTHAIDLGGVESGSHLSN